MWFRSIRMEGNGAPIERSRSGGVPQRGSRGGQVVERGQMGGVKLQGRAIVPSGGVQIAGFM